MARFRSQKNSFIGGQISPTAVGRVDQPNYPHSSELLQNMIPMLSGGAYRRPGTRLIDNRVITSDYAGRLIPFVPRKDSPYSIYFGHTVGGSAYAFYYSPGTSPGSFISGSISGTPPWLIATNNNIATTAATLLTPFVTNDDEIHQVQYCQSVDQLYLVHPNRKPQILRRSSSVSLKISDFDTDSSGTPLVGQDLVNSYPYLNQNTSGITLSSSNDTVGTGRTLTASGSFFDAKMIGSIFVIDMTGGTVGAVQVTAYTNSTTVTCKVLVALGASGGASAAKSSWWESAWSNYRGWPRSCCIYQQRLCFAGTSYQPDTMWFSETANYTHFSLIGSKPPRVYSVTSQGYTLNTTIVTNLVDDSPGDGLTTGPLGSQPFRITISENQLDTIQWLSPDKQLLIGTNSQEFLASFNNSFDVSNAIIQVQSSYGSDFIPASRIGYELIFPMASQDELRAYQYNFIDSSFFAEPVQVMFDQYPKPEPGNTSNPGRRKYRSFQWDGSRNTLWCIDTCGNFFGMTRDRKLGITAWHTHQLGGYDSTKGHATIGTGSNTTLDSSYFSPDGSVLSMIVLPNPSGSNINDVYMIVKRTVSGVVNFHMERMIGKNISRETAYTSIYPGFSSCEPFQVDATGYRLDDSAGSKVIDLGVSWLDGYSLTGTYYSAINGMFKLTTDTVSSGICNIISSVPSDYGTASNAMAIGLPFTSIIKPVRLESGSVLGSAQAEVKRVHRAFVRFYKSICAKMGSAPNGEDSSSLETIYFRDPGSAIGKSPELFTGDKKVLMPSTYDRDAYIYIEQDQPLPFTVISVVVEGETYEE